MFLHANRHNYRHLLEQEPPGAAPSQVRRAEEYIAANWNRPIGLETLAAVTGVSASSLSRSFRKSRGYTPLQFAKQVRLRKQTEH
jgi:AraC-like DNA-binding protein